MNTSNYQKDFRPKSTSEYWAMNGNEAIAYNVSDVNDTKAVFVDFFKRFDNSNDAGGSSVNFSSQNIDKEITAEIEEEKKKSLIRTIITAKNIGLSGAVIWLIAFSTWGITSCIWEKTWTSNTSTSKAKTEIPTNTNTARVVPVSQETKKEEVKIKPITKEQLDFRIKKYDDFTAAENELINEANTIFSKDTDTTNITALNTIAITYDIIKTAYINNSPVTEEAYKRFNFAESNIDRKIWYFNDLDNIYHIRSMAKDMEEMEKYFNAQANTLEFSQAHAEISKEDISESWQTSALTPLALSALIDTNTQDAIRVLKANPTLATSLTLTQVTKIGWNNIILAGPLAYEKIPANSLPKTWEYKHTTILLAARKNDAENISLLKKAVAKRIELDNEKIETANELTETATVTKLREDAKARPIMMQKASTEKLNKLRQVKVTKINSINDEKLKYDLFDTYSRLDPYFKKYLPEDYQSIANKE